MEYLGKIIQKDRVTALVTIVEVVTVVVLQSFTRSADRAEMSRGSSSCIELAGVVGQMRDWPAHIPLRKRVVSLDNLSLNRLYSTPRVVL